MLGRAQRLTGEEIEWWAAAVEVGEERLRRCGEVPVKRVEARCRTSRDEAVGGDGVTKDPLTVAQSTAKRVSAGEGKNFNFDGERGREEGRIGG